MSPASEPYAVSSDSGLLDLDFVCAALGRTYWAQGRPRSLVEESIRNSVCFGAYEAGSGRQVAFARVVTDGATFSWLCDVVVDDGHRGRGLGKRLVAAALAHPRVGGTFFLLATRDAHGLYEKYGFSRVEMMKRLPQAEVRP
jgi:GNAT superfamily N-acetyltransferase